MATCKDCLHRAVCAGRTPREATYQYVDYMGCVNVEYNCINFMDGSRIVELPCKPGTHLWRITTPYRGEPKVTEFVVKNFRTAGKRRQLQLEVQAINVPVTNWMRYQGFYETREEAEKALAEQGADHGKR